jgi:hypothetical protein
MNNIYMMAHCDDVYRTDFFLVGTGVPRDSCPACERGMGHWKSPYLYEWDVEFGTPDQSIEKHHDCRWGGMYLMVTARGRKLLSELDFHLTFHRTIFVQIRFVRREMFIDEVPQPKEKLHFVRPHLEVNADLSQLKTKVCDTCGYFVRPRWLLKGLKIKDCPEIHRGPFTVRQNGVHHPFFVTEQIKQKICASGLTGVTFYPAGEIVG